MKLFRYIKTNYLIRSTELVEWIVHSPRCSIWRFYPYRAYLKYGALLKVRKGQIALLVNEGKIADMFNPGEYRLTTENMPMLKDMKKWGDNFNAPFKVDVYFVSTKPFVDMSWETDESILMNEREFGPIYIRARGLYNFKIDDKLIVYIRSVAERDSDFSTSSITEQLRKFVLDKFAKHLAETKINGLDLSTNLEAFSNEFTTIMKNDFANYGIELTKFSIEKIVFPEMVKTSLYKQANIRSVGMMINYSQMKLDDFVSNEKKN